MLGELYAILCRVEQPARVRAERRARRQRLLGEDAEPAPRHLRLGHEQAHARVQKASRPPVVDAQSRGADQRRGKSAGTEAAQQAVELDHRGAALPAARRSAASTALGRG